MICLATIYCWAFLNFKGKKENGSYTIVGKFVCKIHPHYLENIKLTVSLPAHDKEASRVQKNISIVLADPPVLQDVTALIKDFPSFLWYIFMVDQTIYTCPC